MSKSKKSHLGAAWVLWCQQHADELPLSMERIHDEGDTTIITFHGAHPNLRCVADANGLRTSLHWFGEWCGDLYEFDLVPKRDRQGRWYCAECDADKRDYFASLSELWNAHVFSEWLKHIQRLFAPDTWVLYGDSGCDVLSLRRLFEKGRHVNTASYALMFRACADPQALNPHFIRPTRKDNRLLGGFLSLGPSVTGIGVGDK